MLFNVSSWHDLASTVSLETKLILGQEVDSTYEMKLKSSNKKILQNRR